MKNSDLPVALTPKSSRRSWLVGLVASASALVGAGFAWRAYQPQALNSDLENALWAMTFMRPDGQTLRMADLRGKPVLINFWATWCPPCIEELPLLNSFFNENAVKGWQVLGLAVDQLKPVQRFLVTSPLDFPVVMAGLPGLSLSKEFGNLSGGLPFTVVFGSDGRVLHRKMGKLKPEDLQAWAALS